MKIFTKYTLKWNESNGKYDHPYRTMSNVRDRKKEIDRK